MNKQKKFVLHFFHRNGVSKYGLLICIMVIGTFISCHKEDPKEEIKTVVIKVDMEGMVHTRMPGYQLQRRGIVFIFGREYLLTNEQDLVVVTIGLHKNAEKADSIAHDYLKSVNGIMQEGELEVSIGDKFWWLPTNDLNHWSNIVFIRKNALVTLNSHTNRTDLKELAKKIDNDILNDAEYVELANRMLGPVIDSISVSKPVLREGERTKITVHVSNPSDEPLAYSAEGLTHDSTDPENVFIERAELGYMDDPFFATHQYGVVVMNTSNAISELAHFEITITE